MAGGDVGAGADAEAVGFPGERAGDHMRKLARATRATCATCRQFDGSAWCRRWNYHTEPEAPVCDQYRARERAEPPAPA